MSGQATLSQITGLWIAAFLSLCIFSFLWKDNPLYKFAEHLFVGVSAGYMMAVDYWNVLKPNLIDRLAGAGNVLIRDHTFSQEWLTLIPALLSLFMLLRLWPRLSWVSRLPMAFIVGVTAGINIVYTMQAQILKQIEATLLPLWVKTPTGVDFSQTCLNWLILIGVCCGLLYFFFSREHKGLLFGGGARVGVWVLMIAFGAAFGYTVMARVSLLIGRILFFKNEWWPAAKATFAALLTWLHLL